MYRVTYRRQVSYRGFFLAVERWERQSLGFHYEWSPYVQSWPYEWWDVRDKLVAWLQANDPEVFTRPAGHRPEPGDRGGVSPLGWHEALMYSRTLWLGYAGNALTLLCLGVFIVGMKERIGGRRKRKAAAVGSGEHSAS